MKAITIDFWKNINGWHYIVDMDDCQLQSGISFRSLVKAKTHMEEKTKTLGINIEGIDPQVNYK